MPPIISNSDSGQKIDYKPSVLKVVFLFLVSGLWTLVSGPLLASDFHLKATSLGQVRENANNQNEIPLNNYLGMSGANASKTFSAATNMRLFRDLEQNLDDYDLYQAVIHYKPSPDFKLDGGRQLVTQGFFLETVDGVQTTMGPFGHVGFTLYSGIPRSVERGDFNKNDGLLTGLSIGLEKIDHFHLEFHGAWRKNDIYRDDLKQNDEIFAGADFMWELPGKMASALYGTAEYDTLFKIVNTGTLGLDLYPSKRISLNFEGNYFDISRQTDRLTIQRVFTDGRTWGGRFASTWTLIPKFLNLVESYAYRNVEAQGGSHSHGHWVDTALQISFEKIGLDLEPGYYFSKSFGGDLHGVRALIHEQFTEKFYTDLVADYTTYDKITNDNDKAISTGGWIGYEAAKGLTLSGGFEYNRNNLFNKDARGSFKIDYEFDHES